MAVRYAWECPECQSSIELATTQAGQHLKCESCSAEVLAPKLGVIKSLTVVDSENAITQKSKSARGEGSAVKGWLFAGGLLLAVLASICAMAAQYRSNQYRVDVDLDEVMANEYEGIDKAPPAQVYAIAVEAGKESFTLEYSEPAYRTYSKKSGYIQTVAWVFWGLAGVGLIMLLGSFLLKK
jgi:hypothetical protein